MAIGRIKRRHAAHTPQSSPLCSTVSVTIIAVIVFCSLTFELTGKHDPAARDKCHSKCNNHLQRSASIPSAMNALFQNQGMFDQHQNSMLQGNGKSSAAVARPRRLPTLIKILTGFGDEHQRSSGHYYDDNDRPIIVRRIDRQEFIDQSTPDNPTQQAAVAAAAAVFSQSLRVYGNHRMKNVNAEWEQALVWIAGWDHNQMAQPSPSSNRGNNRGYDSTDDFEKTLEECIKQCIDDKDSDITAVTEEDKRSSEELEMHGFVGESTLSSFFDWVTSFSFSKLPLRTMVSSESLYILTKTFQLVASSMAMYALHSIWVWTSPVISAWYTSLGYTESPKWLLEHERELQQAKSSRARQRKKSKSKRRQQQTRKAAKQGSKQTPIKEEVQVHQKEDPIDKNISNRGYLDSNHLAKNRVSPPPDPEPRKDDVVQVPSKADDSSSQLSEGIPSLITYSTTSASIYSPSLKPLHGEDRDIPQESLLHSKTTLQGPVFPHLPLNGLSVPTQEQREKAANQLREFQAAQIQKLLLKKKKLAAQSANSGISSPTATAAQSVSSIAQPKKVMKPPPGFSQPSESILPTQNDDTGGFLSNNEVFLSKLLDDDEDDGDKKTSGVKIHILSSINAPSMSPEPQSSLNPAAAPFIGSKIEDDQVTSINVSKMKKEDSWQSKPSDVSFKDNSPAGGGIKGVYGGSVW